MAAAHGTAPWCIVSLKAFGDLLIAYRCLLALERAPVAEVRILAGTHLRDFVAALGAGSVVGFLDSGPGYPAAWDIRNRGLRAGLHSLARLRPVFRGLPREYRLLFDILGWRERFLGGSHHCRGLLSAPNVYHAFARTFREMGLPPCKLPDGRGIPATGAGIARIYAASRVPAKTLPPEVVERVSSELTRRRIDSEVIALGDEPVQTSPRVRVRRIERSFPALLESIRSSSLVISADSLPAHLADFCGRPVHVVSARPNPYWLPLGCFLQGGESLFGDQVALSGWLDRLDSSGGPAGAAPPASAQVWS